LEESEDEQAEEQVPESEEEQEEETADGIDIYLESDEGEIYHLVEGENRVGRSAGNEIHIVAEKISRHHARLLLTGEKLEVIDLGSTNGTFVNEEQLEPNQPAVLKEGDQVRFGDQSFTVQTK
jgi:pSer/pThr/pTyr-binding forkhead associated (FHA) protein